MRPVPAATTWKETVVPAVTLLAEGCVRIVGFTPDTVSCALLEVTLPAAFVTTQRYRQPLFVVLAVTVRLALVLPLHVVQLAPLFLLYCH